MERHQISEPWPEDCDRVRSVLRQGVTTQHELVRRFGPPTAAMRRGATAVFPPPGLSKAGRIEVQSDAFFELFSARRTIDDNDVIYYYEAARLRQFLLVVMPIIGGGFDSHWVESDRLWVLVNGSTGIVEDHAVRCE